MKIEGCFKEVYSGLHVFCKEVQRDFKEVSKVFQGSIKGVLRKFLGWYKEVPRVLQKSFKGVSRKLQ